MMGGPGRWWWECTRCRSTRLMLTTMLSDAVAALVAEARGQEGTALDERLERLPVATALAVGRFLAERAHSEAQALAERIFTRLRPPAGGARGPEDGRGALARARQLGGAPAAPLPGGP